MQKVGSVAGVLNHLSLPPSSSSLAQSAAFQINLKQKLQNLANCQAEHYIGPTSCFRCFPRSPERESGLPMTDTGSNPWASRDSWRRQKGTILVFLLGNPEDRGAW